MYYLGIDGFGRYTKLLMMDGNGRVMGRHSGAPTDLRLQPAASVAHNMNVLIHEIGRLTNTIVKDCKGLCYAVPAPSVKTNELALVKMFKNIGFGCAVKVVSVERAALAAKIGNEPGALLFAGNDISGYIWRGGGNEAFIGGYGPLIETPGSAHAIGAAALRRVIMAMDGRGAATGLTELVVTEFGVKDTAGILPLINAPDYEMRKIADLASIVEKAARLGDGVAMEIEAEAARNLAVFGVVLMNQSGVNSLILGGATLLLNESVARQTQAALRTKFPLIQILQADEKPEMGAARIAKLNAD